MKKNYIYYNMLCVILLSVTSLVSMDTFMDRDYPDVSWIKSLNIAAELGNINANNIDKKLNNAYAEHERNIRLYYIKNPHKTKIETIDPIEFEVRCLDEAFKNFNVSEHLEQAQVIIDKIKKLLGMQDDSDYVSTQSLPTDSDEDSDEDREHRSKRHRTEYDS